MVFQPDIVVASPGEPTAHLVVEAKLRPADSRAAEEGLKHYMVRMRAPAGILVTRDAVSVFRDTFRSYSEQSIEHVGTVRTDTIPELQPFAVGMRTDAIAFEDAVQSWLVHLRNRLAHGYGRGVDAVLAEHVMPALLMGEIRAAGPRGIRSAVR